MANWIPPMVAVVSVAAVPAAVAEALRPVRSQR
jgi:hypothetical protein